MQRLARQVTRIWDSEKDDAALLLLPPLGLLIMGWIIGWIGRGFHERAASVSGSEHTSSMRLEAASAVEEPGR
jgi:hypothetical protein